MISSDKLEEAVVKEEKAEEEVQVAVETSKPVKENSNNNEPFLEGDKVTHGVYGNGTVLQLNKAKPPFANSICCLHEWIADLL